LSLGLAVVLAGCATVESMRARLVRTPSPCADQTVHVYFEPLSAALTPEGRAVIDAAAQSARSCRVRAVEVLGLADARGAQSSQANLELSQRRASSVSTAL